MMSHLFNLNMPMQSIILSERHSLLKQSLFVLFGVLMLTLASQLSIPLYPVPLTLQSTTVVLIGMLYGARLGTYVVTAYVAAGLIGIPVFADFTGGFATTLSLPTLGYLIGFFPAVWVSGFLAERGCAKNKLSSFVAAFLGVSFIFLFGLIILAQYLGWQEAIAVGLLPFIMTEPAKLLAVACLIPTCWKPKA